MIDAAKKAYSTFVSELGWPEANNPQSTRLPIRCMITGKRMPHFSE